MRKLSNTEAELKKSVAYKKSVYIIRIISDQKSCETLKTVICGGPRHAFETMRLKRWRKSKAFN